MAHFSKESLEKFQEMCAEGMDFGEGEVYDFVMCLEPSGDVYGIEPGETCVKGKQISDEEGSKHLKNKDKTKSRMAKLKAAYLKKTGRKMSATEMNKARQMLDKKNGTKTSPEEAKKDNKKD